MQADAAGWAAGGQKLADVVHMWTWLQFLRELFQRDQCCRQCLRDHPVVMARDSLPRHQTTFPPDQYRGNLSRQADPQARPERRTPDWAVPQSVSRPHLGRHPPFPTFAYGAASREGNVDKQKVPAKSMIPVPLFEAALVGRVRRSHPTVPGSASARPAGSPAPRPMRPGNGSARRRPRAAAPSV
jgi:hypothetical protein